MKLRKLNGRYQLIISTEQDLLQLPDLDPIYWSANSAPTEGLSCDTVFLKHLDSDNNKRIMPFEIIDACRWLRLSLISLQDCIEGKDSISLSNFRQDTDVGVTLLETALLVLQNLGKEDQKEINLVEVQSRSSILESGAMNGDGIIPPMAIDDPKERQLCQDIISVFGGVEDINGEKGVNEEMVLSFPSQAKLWLQWKQQKQENVSVRDFSTH